MEIPKYIAAFIQNIFITETKLHLLQLHLHFKESKTAGGNNSVGIRQVVKTKYCGCGSRRSRVSLKALYRRLQRPFSSKHFFAGNYC